LLAQSAAKGDELSMQESSSSTFFSSSSSNAAMNLQYKVQQSRKVAVSDALPLEVVPPAPVSQFIQLIYLANCAK